jgi:hypothetical protein
MENKKFLKFMEECCRPAPNQKEITLYLWESYLNWCLETSTPALKPEEFLEEFQTNDLEIDAGYVVGIRLTDDARMKLDEARRKAERPRSHGPGEGGRS